ncbi:DNA translocase FtsK 4TM domain-containing protein, partial [Roseomonas aerophila]
MSRALADRSPSPTPSGGRLAAGARKFASPAVKAALRRRGAELAGLALGVAGVALLVALLSYNPADPSLSTASSRETTNLAGAPGAILSDLMLQGFGWAAMLPSAVALGWAWRLATHRGLAPFAGRLAAVLAAVPLLAAALHLVPATAGPSISGPGGAVGDLLAGLVLNTTLGVFGAAGHLVGQVVIVALAGSLSFAAIGVPLLAWLHLGRGAGRAARGSAALTTTLLRRPAPAEPPPWQDQPDAPDEAPAWDREPAP